MADTCRAHLPFLVRFDRPMGATERKGRATPLTFKRNHDVALLGQLAVETADGGAVGSRVSRETRSAKSGWWVSSAVSACTGAGAAERSCRESIHGRPDKVPPPRSMSCLRSPAQAQDRTDHGPATNCLSDLDA